MKKTLLLLLLISSGLSNNAQNVVNIDYKTKRYIGDISALNRDKYVTGHFLFDKEDSAFTAFKKEYNIKPSYIGSRRFYNPLGKVKDGVIPKIKKIYSGVRNVTPGMVATGTDHNLFFDKNVDYSIQDVSDLSKKAAKYVAESYCYDWKDVPEYIEPFNEPMVHADELYPKKNNKKVYDKDKINIITDKICQYHYDLGKEIHAASQLKNMKVMGYASAFPEFEANNFELWNKRYKSFMDIAGSEVDIFSLHLYDGRGINNNGGRRSGSNAEAILDLIDTYSYIKFNKVKPLAITEYGRLVDDQPGWRQGGNISNYNAIENSQAVRSQLHFVMNFMDRADHLELAIPFNVDTRNTASKYCKSSIWIKDENGKLVTTNRKLFYEMLKDLKGSRVRINSNNIDVQTQAFVDGNTLYVMLNNLNDNSQKVNLNLIDKDKISSVNVKTLKIYSDRTPVLSNVNLKSVPENISLEYGETAVITYKFKNKISFDNAIRTQKYYSKNYMTPIKSNIDNHFEFLNVVSGSNGNATLRISVGRQHGKSLQPIITINGKEVAVKGDIIRGYNQENRKSFFGTLEIPLQISLLKSGTNNVDVKFSDEGGYVSSVILQVEKADKKL